MIIEKKSKNYIIEGLFQLMERKDFKDITITDISKRAGVNRVTFYRNFDSKEDIIRIYLEESFKEWGRRWEECGDPNIAFQIFKYFDEQRRIIPLLYKANLQYLLEEKILIACGYKEDDTDVIAYGKSMFAYAVFGWCTEWFKRGMKETAEEMARIFEQHDKVK